MNFMAADVLIKVQVPEGPAYKVPGWLMPWANLGTGRPSLEGTVVYRGPIAYWVSNALKSPDGRRHTFAVRDDITFIPRTANLADAVDAALTPGVRVVHCEHAIGSAEPYNHGAYYPPIFPGWLTPWSDVVGKTLRSFEGIYHPECGFISTGDDPFEMSEALSEGIPVMVKDNGI